MRALALAATLLAGCYLSNDFSGFSTRDDAGGSDGSLGSDGGGSDGGGADAGPGSEGWTVEVMDSFPTLRAVAGLGTRVVAVGAQGVIVESSLTVSGWRTLRAPDPANQDLSAVWVGQDLVVAAGRAGTVLFADVNGVHPVTTPISQDLHGISQDPTGTFDIVGDDGMDLYGPDLTALKVLSLSTQRLRASFRDEIVGDSGTYLHFDAGWLTGNLGLPVNADLLALGGDRRDALWAVGTLGVIVGFDGVAATRTSYTNVGVDLNAVSVPALGVGWAAGAKGALARLDSGAWHLVAASPTTRDLFGIYGDADGHYVAVGTNGVVLRCCPP